MDSQAHLMTALILVHPLTRPCRLVVVLARCSEPRMKA